MSLPTVKIHDPNDPNDYVIINERDYDPAAVILWGEKPVNVNLRNTAIEDATRLVMESGDTENLIASGAPKVPVLEQILGYDITAEERDVAWVEYTDQ